jgi:hypothetical protein
MHRHGESGAQTADGGAAIEQGHIQRVATAENFSIDGPDCRS